MDREKLVNLKIGEARKLIDLLRQEPRIVVSDAYWMEDLEFDEWTLNIVSPSFHGIGDLEAFGTLTRVFRAHPEIQIDDRELRPRGIDTPAVVEALDFIRRYPATEAFRLGGVYIKGHFIQRALLCPVLLDGKTGSEIRGEPLGVG